jgi:hypothetical protein
VTYERLFEEQRQPLTNVRDVASNAERPGPAFVALRAATLGIDDLSRQALRGWVMNGLDFHGRDVPDHPAPSEPATVVIAAGIMTLTDRERVAYRTWLGRWTDYTGRVITPNELAQRHAQLLADYEARPHTKPALPPADDGRRGRRR